MTSTFDASASYSPVLSPIVSYEWDFGDGSTGTGVRVTHPYTLAGKYRVNLTVTDDQGASSSTQRFVSPANTTVDVLLDQFFTAGCPYDDYWELRYMTYGDRILRNSAPCTDFYPWVLITSDLPHNPSYVYTLYRRDARVRNFPGYDLNEPVMLPVLNSSVQPDSSSYIQFNLTFDYLNSSMIDAYAGTDYPVNPGFSDGFGYLVRGNITMDLTMSKRIFGVVASTPSEAQTWWDTHTTPGGITTGVEADYAAFLEQNGNTKYDVYNGFEWYYQVDITDLNATVAPNGTTRVSVFWDGWAFDTLLARFFYWGAADYSQAVNSPYGTVQPQGWMPMESCWCERAKINGTIRSSLDLDFTAIQAYSFMAWANWGPDNTPGTDDDLPAWVWTPVLMDYVPRLGSGSPAAGGYGNSELYWYEGKTSFHGSPGSFAYGELYEYLVPPARWTLDVGSSLTLVLPKFSVPWYDPVGSKWDATAGVGDYVTFDSPMTLRLIRPPGDYFMWDSRAKVISIAGPHDWGSTALPLDSAPWIEFGPESPGPDSVPPTTTASTSGEPGSAGWFRSDVTVTLFATDLGSGVAGTWYKVDGDSYRAYTGPFVVSGDGTHAVSYYSTDNANNNETPRQLAIQIDTTSPGVAAAFSGTTGFGSWWRSSVTATLTASDDTSGLASVICQLDGGVWLTCSAPVAIYTDGVHELNYTARDVAGNSRTGRDTLRIDTTAPSSDLALIGTKGTNGWYVSDVSGQLTGSDATSGLVTLAYRVDGGAWLTYVGPISLGDGRHAVEYRATDAAGNSEAARNATVDVDSTAPVLLGLRPSGTLGGPEVSFTWFGSDNTSGIVRYEVSLDGQPFRSIGLQSNMSAVLADGSHSLRVRAIDAAGNSEEASTTVLVDTNFFSPSGPYAGLPSYLIVAGVVLAAAALFFRRRRGKSPRSTSLTRPRDRGPGE